MSRHAHRPHQPIWARRVRTVYLVYDQADGEAADALQSTDRESGVLRGVFRLMEGSESEVREVHETSMVLSDAVLIYYGNCTEHWVRMRLLDLMKVHGWGRTDPYLAQALLGRCSRHATQGEVARHAGSSY